MTTWIIRSSHDGAGPFSTFDQALRRARQFYNLAGHEVDIYEVDEDGNETSVAHVPKKKK